MQIQLLRNMSCRRREQEEDRVREWMRRLGHTEVNNPEQAEQIIFTSCAYDKYTYDLALDILSRLESFKDKTIVCGCLPEIDPQACGDYTTIPLYGLNDFLGMEIPDKDVANPGVHISHGCIGRCNYCAINKATKRHHSIPAETIVEAVATKEHAILLAENSGCWGIDIGSNLPELLDALPRENKIDLDNMDVYWFMLYYDYLKPLLLSGYIDNIEIGVQSFSAPLVAKMGRPTIDYELFGQRIRYLADKRREATGLAYTDQLDIHLLAHHPQETAEDYRATVRACQLYLCDDIPYTHSPFFRHKCCTIEEPDTLKYPQLYPKNLPWICERCCLKRRDCICVDNNKGVIMW